ncbi:MAG: succinylglutamate desuccinylase/aspartoacylase family protein [Bacteroidia bacterium]|nr:succinylglutamate desuccinylase/aspartoacylase family protein [Bacteroidia bacterium]
MRTLEINGTIVKPGKAQWLNVNTYSLTVGAEVAMPAYVINAKADGPVVLFTAGMHGDEINGIETLRQLLQKKVAQHLQRGAVIIIPVVNTISFMYKSRALPDGKDLNRCFPGAKNGSLGARIAYDMMQKILPLIDVGVDFHTGGAQINNYPHLRCKFDEHASVDLAKQFGAPFLVNSEYREKSFRKEAARLGKTILVYEAGESLRLNKLAIKTGLEGCERLLKNLDMLPHDAIEPYETAVLQTTTWLRAKNAGLFRTYKKHGDYVTINEKIAAVTDTYGKEYFAVLSTVNGYIIGVNNSPVVNVGDALLHVGCV